MPANVSSGAGGTSSRGIGRVVHACHVRSPAVLVLIVPRNGVLAGKMTVGRQLPFTHTGRFLGNPQAAP